jgi:hypothetical protein
MGLSDHITIISPEITPRLKYVTDYLSSAMQVTLMVTKFSVSNIESIDTGSCIINYSDKPVNGAFNIFAAGLLNESGIRQQEPGVIKHHEQTMLFPAPATFDLPFDLFSAVFYLLSRYEEYLPFKPDRHGRFEANQSLAYRHNFLEEPVVDQWIAALKSVLNLKYRELKFSQQVFRFVATFDVDSPWAYLHKGTLRTAIGLFKNAITLNLSEIHHRLDVIRGKSPDPYDTYDYIRQVEQRHKFRSVFFFLSGNYGRYDVNYALETLSFRKLLDRMKSERTIGIHPSCKSNRSASLLKSEFERFSHFLGKKPEISRQHFLMLRFPYTYRQLIALGMVEDYSMGYASSTGFRAGTCMPFKFYDLTDECQTQLLIHPFMVMDVTLRQYLGLNAGEANVRINRLMEFSHAFGIMNRFQIMILGGDGDRYLRG